MSDMKDTSTNHMDDELNFDEFEPFDEVPPSTNSTQSTTSKQSANTSSVNTGSFDHLSFREPSNPLKLVVLAVIVVIVLGFGLYHLVGKMRFSGFKSKPAAVVATQTATVAPVTVADVNSAVRVEQQKSVDMMNKIGALDQTVNQQQQTMNQIQSNMSTLQDSVNSLNSTVSTVSQQLSDINQKLVKPVVKKVLQPQQVLPPPVTYVVKAMVPGRAWLLENNGNVLSVAVGNAVPSHGVVNQIDLNNGQVMMSDGSVFSYDLNNG